MAAADSENPSEMLETFSEEVGLFADEPDTVAKMRELVRKLAVQGKLVPQDSSDVPSSVLLQRVRGTAAGMRGGEKRTSGDVASLNLGYSL